MSSSPHLRIVSSDPLFGAENDIRALVDKLTIVAKNLSGGAALTEREVRAVDRLIHEALGSAQVVEAAYDARYGARP